MENVVLKLSNINKQYKNGHKDLVHAVKDVSFIVEKKEWIGVVGESGSGKSTLAKLVSHLEAPTSGEIYFKGKNIAHVKGRAKKDYYRNVQMIFQNPLGTFSPRMTIASYMVEPFINFKMMSKKEALEYSKSLLKEVGLEASMMDRYPGELSGGQLQRVVIARTIGLKPDLLICDECTSALDVSIQNEILNLLLSLQNHKDFSVIFITHDLAVAEQVCHKIHVMKEGAIVESLGDDIIRDAKAPYTKQLTEAVYSLHDFS